jgi:hypothetical protein
MKKWVLGLILMSVGSLALAASETCPMVSGMDKAKMDALPVKLAIEFQKTFPEKKGVAVFDVVLKNTSKETLKVMPLSTSTLRCQIGNETWGGNWSVMAGSKEILEPNRKLRQRVTSTSAFPRGDVNIVCSYRMPVDGVNPMVEVVFKSK